MYVFYQYAITNLVRLMCWRRCPRSDLYTNLCDVFPTIGNGTSRPLYQDTLTALVKYCAKRPRTPHEIMAFLTGFTTDNSPFAWHTGCQEEFDMGECSLTELWSNLLDETTPAPDNQTQAFVEGFRLNPMHYAWEYEVLDSDDDEIS